jgi:hypothetical protein
VCPKTVVTRCDSQTSPEIVHDSPHSRLPL